MNGITTEGLDLVRDRLTRRITQRLPIALNNVVSVISDDLYQVARGHVGKDTGALDKSMKKEVITKTPTKVEVDVVAGDPAVSRGVAPFEFDKEGRKVSVKPTSEYAAAHEAHKGYMKEAVSEVDKVIKYEIKKAFDEVFF